MMSSRALYDQWADPYEAAKEEFLRRYGDPAIPFFLQYLGNPMGKVLLDMGCGTGREAAMYEGGGFGLVWGVDESEEMLKKARAKAAHPERFLHGRFDRIPLGNESVDVVTCQYSFHYELDFDSAYSELERILRPGGLLLMANRHPSSDALEMDRSEVDGRVYVRPLIWGKIRIPCPLHQMQEYMSPKFYQTFDLIDYWVWPRPYSERYDPWLFGMASRRRG